MYEAQGNATRAALMAGYSENAIQQTASRLLRNETVKREIARFRPSQINPNAGTIASLEERALFLSELMRDTSLSQTVRLRACEQLARTHGDYANATKTGAVEVEIVYLEPEAMSGSEVDSKKQAEKHGIVPFVEFNDPEFDEPNEGN
jgi:phage terminase small subunit